MKLKSIKRLNASGLAHYVLPLLIVLAVAVVGTFLLVASHADSPASNLPNYGKSFKVVAYRLPGSCVYIENVEQWSCRDTAGCVYVGNAEQWSCTSKKPKITKAAHIYVSSNSPGAMCNGIKITPATDFGTDRKFKCTIGSYNFTLARAIDITYSKNGKGKRINMDAIKTINVVKKKSISTVRLGTGRDNP